MQSCCSPIASASAAAPRAIASQLLLNSWLASASATGRRLCLLQLLLAIASVSTAPRLRPLRLLFPDCVRFNSAPRWHPLRLLLTGCVRFNCCSPIASASAATPRQLFWKIPVMSTILEHSTQSSRFSKLKYTKVARHYSLVPPHEHPTSVTHRQTDEQTHG